MSRSEPYNVSLNRSSGKRCCFVIDVSKLSPETMCITMRLEPSMSLEQPRVGDALRRFRGNTTVIEVRLITVPLASTWGIQFRDSKLSWTVNFISPKNGPTIRFAEKKLHPRRDSVCNEATNCFGIDRSSVGKWYPRIGLDVRRILWARQQIP